MKICPSCREEFLDQIITCQDCKQTLVSEEAAAKLAQSPGISKEDILSQEVAVLLEGTLDACREIEFNLSRANITCVVYPVSSNTNYPPDATLGFAPMKYVVLVPIDSLERCREVLQGHFAEQVRREGQGKFVMDAVDLDTPDISCPACGHRGGLAQGECTSCGLFLGELS